jgi:hypothetical protein
MRSLLAGLLIVHGLVHLLGFAKAFELARLPQLSAVSPFMGVLWLACAVLFCAAGAVVAASARGWWAIAGAAALLSTLVISRAWTDAKFGLIPNVVAALAVVLGVFTEGPPSLRAAYGKDVRAGLSKPQTSSPAITDVDISRLPAPVQEYLRTTGVVGRPRVTDFRVRMHGRIRSGPSARWMPLAAEQHTFVGDLERLFYLDSSMLGLPVQGYHRYAGSSASMTIKVGGIVPVVDVAGDEMHQAETVTMFNDMCIMAPATLIDPAIAWEAVGPHSVKAAFTNAGHTIRAELSFNSAGELTNFSSDDRYELATDGRTFERKRWSTPIGGYRSFGQVRLAATGEARWHGPSGEYAYIELVLDEVAYNVGENLKLESGMARDAAEETTTP